MEPAVTQLDHTLIGHQREQSELDAAFAAVHTGSGGVVLLACEASVGKTGLLDTCVARSELLALKGQANEIATPPYGPIAAALRGYLRARPGSLDGSGPLVPYLALLLPELGPPPHMCRWYRLTYRAKALPAFPRPSYFHLPPYYVLLTNNSGVVVA